MVAESKIQFGRIYKGNPSNLRIMNSGSILLFARANGGSLKPSVLLLTAIQFQTISRIWQMFIDRCEHLTHLFGH